jgi:cytochrome c556
MNTRTSIHRVITLLIALLLACAGISSAQNARTGPLMREKLLHAQRILAGLTTSDYGLLQRETQALTAITRNPVWSELMTADLRPFANDFTKALADLSAASGRRDYDMAGASYSALTTACIQCHKHVMKSRVAGSRRPPL